MTTRTTIRNIDTDVLWDAKIYAAETKQTMGDVVTEAIQCLIQQRDEMALAENLATDVVVTEDEQ